MWKVYIIKSEVKDWFYVGSTDNIERRLKEHNSSKVSSTKPYIPFKLVYSARFSSEKEARGYEKKIKQQRILKENIIKYL